MRLRVLAPTAVVVDEEVRKVTTEAPNGSFTLLPRHVDFVTELTPGILLFETSSGEETPVAIDNATLVKCGAEVRVSARNAVVGRSLEELRRTVEEEFAAKAEHDAVTRSASAHLEIELARRFMELGRHGG